MSNATPRATIMPPPTSRVASRHCSQSGNMIRLSSSSLQLPTAAQRLTGCWHCDISHPPRHAACSTVQLITVTRCPVSPSLYSRWLRPEPTQPSESQPQVIAIRLVPDRKWSQRIPGDLIAIKCWSRQALTDNNIFRMKYSQMLSSMLLGNYKIYVNSGF